MSQTHTQLYVCAEPLDTYSRLSSTASESCFFMDLLMLLHYIQYHIYLVYCWIVLEDAIAVVPTAICGAIPIYLGGLKGVPGATFSCHVSVIALPMIILYPPPHRYLMDL